MTTTTSSLRNLLTFLSAKFVALLAVLGILAISFALVANARPAAAPNPNPTWNVDARILFRAQAEPFDHFAVKDPTIVFSGGRWHMFYTGANASGGWQMLYSSATTLEGFRTAPHTFLSRIGESYFAAPEVFFFEPDNLWYLIYQDGTFGGAYATTTNIADPNSWSGPHSLGISGNLGWDYYVICDTTNCFMYNSPDDNSHRIFRRQTTLANFPTGWSAPSVSLTDTFEGTNVYRSLADGQYYLVVEDLKDNRYYELWSSSSAGGPWTKVSEQWAHRADLTYNADRWTDNVSHGEFLRAGVNQRLEINDINRVDFLIQGSTQLSCCPYQQIPWDLGVMHNYTSGPTPTPTRTPTPGANFLSNADMEAGTTGWVVNGAGTLSSDTTQRHGGTRSIKITGRTAAWNGIGQNVAVSNFPTSGQNYTVSVWVRSQSGTPTAKATVRLTAGSTVTFVNLASVGINSTSWTLLSGTVPVSWSGTLTGVLFYVETAAGTDNIYIDDASLHR